MTEESSNEHLVNELRVEDCKPCRVTGTVTFFGIGTYIIYVAKSATYYANRPILKTCLQAFAFVPYYMSLARYWHLYPFDHLISSKNQK